MTDLLDLDSLLPKSKKVILNGKEYECFPLKLFELLKLVTIESDIANSTGDREKVRQIVIDGLSPLIPGIKTDPDFDITLDQLKALVTFAQKASIPESATEAKQYPVKKK